MTRGLRPVGGTTDFVTIAVMTVAMCAAIIASETIKIYLVRLFLVFKVMVKS